MDEIDDEFQIHHQFREFIMDFMMISFIMNAFIMIFMMISCQIDPNRTLGIWVWTFFRSIEDPTCSRFQQRFRKRHNQIAALRSVEMSQAACVFLRQNPKSQPNRAWFGSRNRRFRPPLWMSKCSARATSQMVLSTPLVHTRTPLRRENGVNFPSE